MSAQPQAQFITAEEYLDLERKAETKSEYYDGVICQRAGARRKHVRVVSNLVSHLDRQTQDRDCNVYASDLRVCSNSVTGLYTYPDVVVTCGEEKFLDSEFDTLLNPPVIFEVSSNSTARYDRNEKFELYESIESLQEYVLVAQDRVKIEHFVRQGLGQWLLKIVQSFDGAIKLESINCELLARDVYAKVDVRDGIIFSEEDIRRIKGKTFHDE